MSEHDFVMDLGPTSHTSMVLMDGEDITSVLRGVRVESGVGHVTTVTLIPVPGQHVQLTARLPEAQIVIDGTARYPGDGCTCGYLVKAKGDHA